MRPTDSQETVSERAAAIWKKYGERVTFFVRRQLRNDDDVADVMQEAFVALQEGLRKETIRDTENPGKFLYGVCRNLVAKKIRERVRRVGLDDVPEPSAPARAEEDAVRRESLDSLRSALGGLDRVDREILELKYVEGRSYVRIAGDLGLTAEAVRQRAHRARDRLRGAMGGGP